MNKLYKYPHGSCIGPGGLKCGCCQPVPGNKKLNRTFVNRLFRRGDKQALNHEVEEYEEDVAQDAANLRDVNSWMEAYRAFMDTSPFEDDDVEENPWYDDDEYNLYLSED